MSGELQSIECLGKHDGKQMLEVAILIVLYKIDDDVCPTLLELVRAGVVVNDDIEELPRDEGILRCHDFVQTFKRNLQDLNRDASLRGRD